MSEQISDPGLTKQLRLRFGIRGPLDAGLETSIIPVANLGDLSAAPYNSKSGGIVTVSQAAVAAQFSYIGLVASTLYPKEFRAVIRSIFSSTTGQQTSISVSDFVAVTAAIGAGVTALVASSWDGLSRPGLISFTTTSAVNVSAPGLSFLPAAATGLWHLEKDFVLSAGQMLLIQGNTLNTLLQASFYWDEYPAVG